MLERTNSSAIILSHIPNLDMCNSKFGVRLHVILERYSDTIRWSASGFAKTEGFNVVMDSYGSKPVGINFMMPSVSTQYRDDQGGENGKDPNFVVMHVDKETKLPVDIETYYMDLKEANAGHPKWKLHHSWKSHYNIPDFSPTSFHNLARDILLDESTALSFIQNRSKSCDFICRRHLFCQCTANGYNKYQECLGKDKRSFSSITESL